MHFGANFGVYKTNDKDKVLNMGISENIVTLRKKYGYSQQEIANKLEISRQTYAKFENGSGDLNTSEIQKVADIFGVTVVELYYELEDKSKFQDVLVYILSKFKVRGLSKSKLMNLIYLSDFSYYYHNLKSISNARYKCKEYGPLAEPFLEVLDDMTLKGELHIDFLDGGAQIITLSESIKLKDFDNLSKKEINTVDSICKKWKDARSQELTDFVKNQKPWMACRPGEIISYDLILQEDPDRVF